jgi:hypothetical protein
MVALHLSELRWLVKAPHELALDERQKLVDSLLHPSRFLNSGDLTVEIYVIFELKILSL